MADFDKINIDSASYNVKDTQAREDLAAETSARQQADTQLGQQISEEATARQQTDTQLGQQITQQGQHIENLADDIELINAVTYGIDNTGTTDVTTQITQFLAEPYKNHYFPSGRYKITSTITLPTPTATNPFSFSAAPDAVFFAGADMQTMFYVGNAPVLAFIVGGVFDCAQKAVHAITVSGSNAPGFVIRNAVFYNSSGSAVVFGSSAQATAGHQWLDGCRIYNQDTLAACVEVYTPDVKIVDCELYYSSEAIIDGSSALFIANTHIWSGGSLQNANSSDYGIHVTLANAVLTLTNVYIDTYTYSILTDNNVVTINATNCFFWYDAERTSNLGYYYAVFTSESSLMDISAEFKGNIPCIPFMPSNLYQYCLNHENPTKKIIKWCDAYLAEPSPASDITISYASPRLILNRADSMTGGDYLVGYIVPAETGTVSFDIVTGTGTISLKNVNFTRTTQSVTFGDSTNKSALTLKIGALSVTDVGNQQCMASPIYLSGSINGSVVTMRDTGSSCWISCLYATAQTASAVIGTLAPS